MRQPTMRAGAFALVLAMLLTLLPGTAFAAPPPDEESRIQHIAFDLDMGKPGTELLGLTKPENNVRYTYENSTYTYLSDLFIPDLTDEPASAQLYAVTTDGTAASTLIAKQLNFNLKNNIWCCAGRLDLLPSKPGTYALELHADGQVYAISTQLELLSAGTLSISDVSARSVHSDDTEFPVYVFLGGNWTDEMLSQLTLRLVRVTDQGEEVLVSSAAGTFHFSDTKHGPELNGTYPLPLTETLDPKGSYFLYFDYPGSEPVLNLTENGGRVWVSSPEACVDTVQIIDPSGTLEVHLKNLTPQQEYTLRLLESHRYPQTVLSTVTITAQASEETLTMQSDSPLNSLDSELSVCLDMGTDWYDKTGTLFHNPYANMGSGEARFYPFAFSSKEDSFRFVLSFGSGIKGWKPGGNVITLRAPDEKTILGSCSDLQVIPVNGGNGLDVTGIMQLDRQALNTFTGGEVLLNGKPLPGHGEWARGQADFTDVDLDCHTLKRNREERTYSLHHLFGEIPVQAELLNAVGKVHLEFRAAGSTESLLSSPAAAGQPHPYRSHPRYFWVLDADQVGAALSVKTPYELWAVDEGSNALQLLDSVYWDPAKMAEPFSRFHFDDAEVGQTSISMMLHYNTMNVSREELDYFKSMTLTNYDTNHVFHVSGPITCKTGWGLRDEPNGYHPYEFTVELPLKAEDGPLEAGSYSVSVDGKPTDAQLYVSDNQYSPVLDFNSVSILGTVDCCGVDETRSYSAKLFRNGQCLTNTPIPMTFPNDPEGHGIQCLYFDPALLGSLEEGTYTFRIYENGFAVSDLYLDILQPMLHIPEVSVNSGEHWDPKVIMDPALWFDITNSVDYPYIRFALSQEELEQKPWTEIRGEVYEYTFTGSEGAATIYFQFAADETGTETCSVQKSFYFCPSGSFGLEVPEKYTGPQISSQRLFTVEASVLVPYCRVYALFRTADGKVSLREMENRGSKDGRTQFSVDFRVNESFDWEGTDGSAGSFRPVDINNMDILVTTDEPSGGGIIIDGDYVYKNPGQVVESIRRSISFPAGPADHIATYRCVGGQPNGQKISQGSGDNPAVITLDIPKETPVTYSFIAVPQDVNDQTVQNIPVTWVLSADGSVDSAYTDRYVQRPGTNILDITVRPGDEARGPFTVWARGRDEDWGTDPSRPNGPHLYHEVFASPLNIRYGEDNIPPTFTELSAKLTDRGAKVSWLCEDEDADKCTVKWDSGEITVSAAEGTVLLPEVTTCQKFTVTLSDLSQNKTTQVIDSRVSFFYAVSGEELLTPDILPVYSEETVSYKLVMPDDKGKAVQGVVWTATGSTRPYGVTIEGDTVTVSPDAGGTLSIQGTFGDRTVCRTMNVKHIDFNREYEVTKSSNASGPDFVMSSVTIQPPTESSIPVKVMLVSYDKDGRMSVEFAAAELHSGMDAVDLTVKYAPGGRAELFLLDAVTGKPMCAKQTISRK